MKLQLTFLLSAFAASAFAATEQQQVASTPEQLRKNLKARGLAEDGGDSGADDSGGAGCFSALNSVEVQGKGVVSIDSLEIGDYVRDGAESYTRVFSFGHLVRDIDYDFVQIYTDSKTPLELTHNHLVFANGVDVRASEVAVGDMLGNKEVTEIKKNVKSKGLYAPVTYSGTIEVSGIKASSYVQMMDHVPVSQHRMNHMFNSLHRAACSINFSWCEQETYDADGFSTYSGPFVKAYMYSNNFSAPVQWLENIVCAILFPAFVALEQFVLAPLASLLVGAYLYYKVNTKKVKSA